MRLNCTQLDFEQMGRWFTTCSIGFIEPTFQNNGLHPPPCFYGQNHCLLLGHFNDNCRHVCVWFDEFLVHHSGGPIRLTHPQLSVSLFHLPLPWRLDYFVAHRHSPLPSLVYYVSVNSPAKVMTHWLIQPQCSTLYANNAHGPKKILFVLSLCQYVEWGEGGFWIVNGRWRSTMNPKTISTLNWISVIGIQSWYCNLTIMRLSLHPLSVCKIVVKSFVSLTNHLIVSDHFRAHSLSLFHKREHTNARITIVIITDHSKQMKKKSYYRI